MDKRTNKAISFLKDKETSIAKELFDISDKVDDLQDSLKDVDLRDLEYIKGDKGDKGDQGDKGDKGDKGDTGPQGAVGEKGLDGKDGISWTDILDGIDGLDGRDGVDGKDGEDGSPDTAIQVRDKLESLKDNERLDVSAIKGFDELKKDIESKVGKPNINYIGGGVQYVKDLSDVRLTNLTDNQSLTWDATSQKWVNETVSGGGGGTWGSITGTLSDQTDLQSALDAKLTANAGITGATKTKITYDANGLVTAGADATTADIADSADKRYVTDAQSTVIGNTSGTNTGDQDLSPYFHKTNDDTDDITVGATNKFATAAEKTKLGHISITQAVDLDALETAVAALDQATILKGTWDASAGTFPGSASAQAGWSYIVSVAGTVDGTAFAINDRIIAILDNASTTTFASNWFKADYTDQVLSVAGKTGAVTLDTSDVTASTDKNYVTDAQQTVIGNTSGTNTGDQTSIVGITGTKAQFDTAVTDGNFMYVGDAPTSHTHTASAVTDFDTAVAANSAVTANTAKVTNATHTGEVTGSTSLTVDKTAITGKSTVTALGSDYILISDTSDSGNLKQSLISDIVALGGSAINRSITVTSGNVTAGSTAFTDYVYLVAGAHTITLPTAVSNTNLYTIKNNHSVAITVNTTSAQTIDGTTTITISPEDSVDIISNNSNWFII